MIDVRPVGAVGHLLVNAVKTPFVGIKAAFGGSFKGIGEINEGINIVPSGFGLGTKPVYGDYLLTYVSNFFRNLFANGLWSLKEQGIAKHFGSIFTSNSFKEMGDAIKLFGSQVTKLSGRGMVLMGGQVALGCFAVIAGLKLCLSAYHKFSELSKGYRPLGERVKNPYIHLIQSAFAASTLVGGVLCFTPFAAFGAAAATAGIVGSCVMGLYKNLGHGDNWINRPNLAPYPISSILRVFKNDLRSSY